MEYGILIPAAPHEPHVTIRWPHPAKLLPELYHALGTDNLDYASVTPERPDWPGGLRLWCRGDSLLQPEPDYNDRAIGLCRAAGYNVEALAGPVVFLGNQRAAEDEVGLHPQMKAWIEFGLEQLRQQGGGS